MNRARSSSKRPATFSTVARTLFFTVGAVAVIWFALVFSMGGWPRVQCSYKRLASLVAEQDVRWDKDPCNRSTTHKEAFQSLPMRRANG